MNGERWHPPTLRTNPEKGGNARVRCACRRFTNADKVLDLRSVDAETRAKWGVGEIACDGCISRALRRRHLALSELAEALGAPTGDVDRIAARDSARLTEM